MYRNNDSFYDIILECQFTRFTQPNVDTDVIYTVVYPCIVSSTKRRHISSSHLVEDTGEEVQRQALYGVGE